MALRFARASGRPIRPALSKTVDGTGAGKGIVRGVISKTGVGKSNPRPD